MKASALIQQLQTLSDHDLRFLMAHVAGVHAHRDGDGGAKVAAVLRRIADRLERRREPAQ